MQRVVRSTLVGLLTIAGLTACGDKVTVPAPQTTPPDATVHGVTVSPSSVNLAVGQSVTLAASVDAGPAVSSRTVTWSSSDATVATVGTDGKVTGVKAGVATITAAATADASVKGAAVVTVGAAPGTGTPQVQIVSVMQNVGAGVPEQPANVAGAFGQLDVNVNVDPNGATVKTVGVTIKVGNDSVTQVQTFSSNSAPVAAEAAASVLTFSFNTAAFNANFIPALHNGTATITAFVTTASSSSAPAASTTVTYALLNADVAVVTESFAPYTNAEGNTTVTQATDANGLPWKGGAVTITANPVLYSGRTVSSVSITLPGANTATQTVTAAPYSATWSATSTSVPNVTRLTLVSPSFTNNGCPIGCEANGVTPLPVTPSIVALDNVGNDLGLGVANAGITGASFRLDNTPPAPPTTFEVAPRQLNWINAAYTFTGTGNGGGYSTATGTAKYVSCGDFVTTANGNGSGSYGSQSAAAGNCTANGTTALQVGVSAAGVSNNSGVNSQTTFTYYYIAASAYVPASSANGTGVTATACDKTGWTKITTGNDIPGSLGGAYVVRVFETDKLGNSRCVDLGAPNGGVNINNGAFAVGKFGVDKIPPQAVYIEPSQSVTCGLNPLPQDNTAAGQNGIYNLTGNNGVAGTVPNVFNIRVGLCDDNSQPSGFSATPVRTMVQRLYIDPNTNAKSDIVGTTNGCPSGLNNSGVCTTTNVASSVPAWLGTGAGGVNPPGTVPAGSGLTAGDDASGCHGCGYYIFTQTPFDNAQNNAANIGANSSATVSVNGGATCGGAGCRQVLIDNMAPIMGGISIPSTIAGGTTVAFATNAQDNLDLLNYDYTLLIPAAPGGDPIATLPIRSSLTQIPGAAAFDNTLTTQWTGALTVPNFIRALTVTTAGNAPQGAGTYVIPSQISGRVYDAAGNASAQVDQPINPVNIPQTNRVDFTAAQPGGGTMQTFAVTNVAANISNGPASSGTPANPTSVTLTAQVVGSETPAALYINPFATVQFYYFDATKGAAGEWLLIGSASQATVTDNNNVTARTITFGVTWDPPASLGVNGALANVPILAIGITGSGDALATRVNTNITLTNP